MTILFVHFRGQLKKINCPRTNKVVFWLTVYKLWKRKLHRNSLHKTWSTFAEFYLVFKKYFVSLSPIKSSAGRLIGDRKLQCSLLSAVRLSFGSRSTAKLQLNSSQWERRS